MLHLYQLWWKDGSGLCQIRYLYIALQQTKRKRGRPRLLDSSGSRIQDSLASRLLDSSGPRILDSSAPEMDPYFAQSSDGVASKTSQSSSSHKVDAAASSTNHAENSDYQWLSDAPMFAAVGDEPTPGSHPSILVVKGWKAQDSWCSICSFT